MMTDPIADYLTRVRNALLARHKTVDIPASKLKLAMTTILERHGYIDGHEVLAERYQGILRIRLKYIDGQAAIQNLTRISRPGIRRYAGSSELPRVKNGLGLGIVSTPRGLMTDADARRQKVGGEILCTVW